MNGGNALQPTGLMAGWEGKMRRRAPEANPWERSPMYPPLGSGSACDTACGNGTACPGGDYPCIKAKETSGAEIKYREGAPPEGSDQDQRSR